MTSPLRKASWDAYLRRQHGKMETPPKPRSHAAEVAYARMLIERVEARRKAMMRKAPAS